MVWNEKIAEIGKMIGGWMKTCQKKSKSYISRENKISKNVRSL